MKYNSSLIFWITLIFIGINKPIMMHAERKDLNKNILNQLCMASLKSKLDKNNKNFKEISHYTCECFFRKFNSGSSIKQSRSYCREKTAEKYNL